MNSKKNAMKLENSPTDRRKAMYGEKDQADYLILAKERSSEKKHRKGSTEYEIKEEEKSYK